MNVNDAAEYLGIARKTLYKWKRQARQNNGFLIVHGVAVPFRYRQTGPAGQGKIVFEKPWLDAIKRAMEGETEKPKKLLRPAFSHIHVELGTP